MRKLKPTKRVEFYLSVYKYELSINGGHGVIANTARKLNVSKQYMHQIVTAYHHRVPPAPKKPEAMFTCKICSMETPVKFKSHRYNVCNHCCDNHIAKCVRCGARFTFNESYTPSYCRECRNTRMREYVKAIRYSGGELYYKLKERQRKAWAIHKVKKDVLRKELVA